MLLVASKGDTSVPTTNTKRLFKASKSADIWIRKSWEQFIVNDCILSEVREDKEYSERILKFLRKVAEEYDVKN